ncbi:MAG: MarR family transcriptional regulator, organic hydroperoxide resistance regulator [Pseudonocardiales bacterium]|jgi:DNA-binding MarR family transcriptional regulator|nr:MarR family transcriptional regulator, organic hydroperoxide resistance regulator [Pseudonocardiales bacterium]
MKSVTASGRGVPDDPLALERQVCFALSIASRSVLSVYRPVLEPMGLTHPQYLVMLALWGESPLSVTELGRLLHLDSPTLSPLLKRLEASGYVTRSRSVTDERVLEIELTRRGRALRAKAEKVPEIIVAKLGIEIADLEALQVALTRVIVAADAV